MSTSEHPRIVTGSATPGAAVDVDLDDGIDVLVDDQPAAEAERRWRDTWWPFVIVAAPFALLFVALAVRAVVVDWAPGHDYSLLELRAGDVGTGQTPLVGPYSRFGWSHPGPLLFYWLAGPYRLLGGRPQGLLLAAVLLNAASVAGILVLARRRGGVWTLAGTAVGVAILLHAMGTDLLISPWNPWIAILPMVVLLLLAWSLALRDWAVLPATVVVASFLVQTHVAYALPVAAALFVAGLFAWWVRTPTPTRSVRRVVVISLGLLVLLWLPPLIDQVAGTHNASQVLRFFSHSQAGQPGLREAAGAVAAEAAPFGPWATGPETLADFSGAVVPDPLWRLAVPFGALLAGAVVALRRRDRTAQALVAVATTSLVVSILSVSRINGALLPYLLRFTWAVSFVVWLAVARAVAPALSQLAVQLWHANERERQSRLLAVAPVAAAAVVVLGLVVLTPGGLLGAEPPDAVESAHLLSVEPRIVAAVQDLAKGGVVLVRPADTEIQFPIPNTRGLVAGLIPELRKNGVDARVVERDWEATSTATLLFGSPRVDDGGPVAGTVTVVGAEKLDGYVPPPGSVELYRIEDRAAVDEAHRIEAELERAFTEAGHPEAIAKLYTSDLRWIVFTTPELGRFGDQIDRLVKLKEPRREAVYWHPGR